MANEALIAAVGLGVSDFVYRISLFVFHHSCFGGFMHGVETWFVSCMGGRVFRPRGYGKR